MIRYNKIGLYDIKIVKKKKTVQETQSFDAVNIVLFALLIVVVALFFVM